MIKFFRHGKTAIRHNYQALLDDAEFMNHLHWIKNATRWNLNYSDEALKEIRSVIDSIETKQEY